MAFGSEYAWRTRTIGGPPSLLIIHRATIACASRNVNDKFGGTDSRNWIDAPRRPGIESRHGPRNALDVGYRGRSNSRTPTASDDSSSLVGRSSSVTNITLADLPTSFVTVSSAHATGARLPAPQSTHGASSIRNLTRAEAGSSHRSGSFISSRSERDSSAPVR